MATDHYVEPGQEAGSMNQPLVRLVGFVVLAAVVLATGFQALGAAAIGFGGF